MRQAENVVDVIQRELLAYTRFTLAERGDPPTDRSHKSGKWQLSMRIVRLSEPSVPADRRRGLSQALGLLCESP